MAGQHAFGNLERKEQRPYARRSWKNAMQILFICGSLREKSLNRQLALRVMEDLKDRAECALLNYDDFVAVPPLNQDLEFPVLDSVRVVRDQVAQADGVWIVSPEYNGTIPGVLKNLLDWLSRPTTGPGDRASAVLHAKRVAFTCVGGGSKGKGCLEALFRSTPIMGACALSFALGIGYTRDELTANTLCMTEDRMRILAQQEDSFLAFLGEGGTPKPLDPAHANMRLI